MHPTNAPNRIRQKSDNISLESSLKEFSFEKTLHTYASNCPSTLHVVWVQNVSHALARVLYANDSNTVVILSRFKKSPFHKVSLVAHTKHLQVASEEGKSHLRCVTFAKLSEQSSGGLECPDYIRDTNKFDDYSQLESQIEKIAKEQGKSICHVVGSDWMRHLYGKIKNQYIIPPSLI